MTPVPLGPSSTSIVEGMRGRALAATTTAFTISDPHQDDNPLIYVNPAFTAMTGYSPEQALGRNCRFLQGPGTDRAALARVRDALQAGRGVTETLLNHRADGTSFYNELSISAVHDERGDLTHYVGVQVDVSDRVAAEHGHARALAAERRARAGLALLAAVTDAVVEVDSARGVAEIVSLLLGHDDVGWDVAWAAAWATGDLQRLVAGAVGPGGTVREELQVAPRALASAASLIPGVVSALAAGDAVGPQPVHAAGPWLDGPLGAWLQAELGERWPCPGTAVELPGRSGPLGVLVVGSPTPISQEGSALLLDVARRVGLSLENARLYDREHAVAETLQRSLLPAHLRVPDLDTWSYYAPGEAHSSVGGDWFDAVPLSGGGTGLVIGDVVGHDLVAAAAMGQLRSVVRACAVATRDPAAVVSQVDRVLLGMGGARLASLVYGTLVRLGGDNGERVGRWRFTWTRAGHPPPLVVRERVVEQLVGAGGLLVGVADVERATASTVLGPGDVLVLYTDGLVERRGRPVMDGVAQLERLLAAGGAPTMTAAQLGELVLAGVGGSAIEDDTALVLVRVPLAGEDEASRSGVEVRRWQVAGTPRGTASVRRQVGRACEAWGLAVLAQQAELVVSELVGNALLHAWGPVELRVQPVAAGLLVEVDDASPHPPASVAPGVGYGLEVVRRLAELGWRTAPEGKTVWAVVRRP